MPKRKNPSNKKNNSPRKKPKCPCLCKNCKKNCKCKHSDCINKEPEKEPEKTDEESLSEKSLNEETKQEINKVVDELFKGLFNEGLKNTRDTAGVEDAVEDVEDAEDVADEEFVEESSETEDIIPLLKFFFKPLDPESGLPPPPPILKAKKKKKLTIKDFKINLEHSTKINDITDLIKLVDHPEANVRQKEFLDVLNELNSIIGLKYLKEQLTNQIIFFLLNLFDPSEEMYLHTVITGNPGSGKTTIANIIAKIYKSLGFLSNDTIVKADRASLIAEYLGQTAIKTKKVLNSAKGGVLLIDEAYSLGSTSTSSDSFAKECVDTLNQYLSEHANDFICIIAGYEKAIEDCFFKQNEGLKRRFSWRFNIDNYDAEDLYSILLNQLKNWKLDVDSKYVIDQIKKNMNYFSNNGGDTKVLLEKCQVIYARRIICMNTFIDKTLSKDDFNEGLKNFLITRKGSEKPERDLSAHKAMYI